MGSFPPQSRLARWILLGAGTVACLGAGCAHDKSASRKKMLDKIDELKSRIKELERSKGQTSVRLDEMEDEIFLLQDRVEANRLALKRRRNRRAAPPRRRASRGTSSSSSSENEATSPPETPNTHYRSQRRGRRTRGTPLKQGQTISSPRQRRRSGRRSSNERRGQTQGRARAGDSSSNASGSEETSSNRRRNVRIREQSEPTQGDDGSGDDDGDPIVITEEDFEQFASQYDGDEPNSDKNETSETADTGGSKQPQPRVTDEKLATSESTASKTSDSPSPPSSDEPSDASSDDKPFAGRKGLDLYRMALAEYRSGNYETALRGFESFLDGGPRKDYRDNGLYWVGECRYGLGEYQKAIDHFQRVLDEEPNGNKVPDAMLKMALAYRQIGKLEKTRSLLKKVTRRYPGTNAGRLGKKKLSKFDS